MDYEKIVLDLLERVNELEKKVEQLEFERYTLIQEDKCFKRDNVDRIVLENNCLMGAKSTSQVEEIANYISEAISKAIGQGLDHIVVKSGDLHRTFGLTNRIPSVCRAMRNVLDLDKRIKKHVVLKDTPSHNSSTYTIRYEF